MNNEYIFVVTEAYVRGERAAEYAMENNFSLFDLKAFFEQRKPCLNVSISLTDFGLHLEDNKPYGGK